MSHSIVLRAPVELGVVPTHLKFVGGLVPEADGRLPRNADGEMVLVAGMRELVERSPVAIARAQVSLFPGARPEDLDVLVGELKKLGLEVDFVLMVGGVNPMEAADEEAVLAQMLPSLESALRLGARRVASTSLEEWMSAESAREGASYEAAIEQIAKLHVRAYHEAGLEGSAVESWNIEFLRPGEFKTFTSLQKGWDCVHRINQKLGKPFFKILVDAAHCADSGVSLAENLALLQKIADAQELGVFHASAKTTRGCLSTDDGWVGAMLAGMAKTGALKTVFVEMFDHRDAALEPLRQLDSGHGVDTTDGRSYTEVVADGLADIARRLNNFSSRGIL